MSYVTGSYETRDEAIRAALDDLTEPGDQLIVHADDCTAGPLADEACPCMPQVWTYPT